MDKTKSRLKNLFIYLGEFTERFREWFLDFTRWFLADVAYTLLPIAVIASIKALTYSEGNYLYLSPEWSFATIVSFGAAITGLIELKTEIQQDTSHRVYSGTRLYVLLLIIAVIVLSLVVLREDGLYINSQFLWLMQLSLLFLSLASLYIAHIVKKREWKQRAEFPSEMGRGRYYKILNKKLNDIQDEVTHLKFALRKHPRINFPTAMSFQDIQFWENNERTKLQQRFHQLEQSINEMNNLSIELFKSPIPKTDSDETTNETRTERPKSSRKNA